MDENWIVRITQLSDRIEFIKICCGHHHTIGLDKNGILYTWGMGS